MHESYIPLAAQKIASDEDEEEEAHFQQVCRSYQQYATFHQTIQQGVIHRVRQLLERSSSPTASPGNVTLEGPTIKSILPPSLIPNNAANQHQNKLFCDATIRNQFFLDSVLRYSGVMTSQEILMKLQQSNAGCIEWATEDQMSKVDSVLKSVARDWSVEGLSERSVVYDRILTALEKYLPLEDNAHGDDTLEYDEGPPRIAVPGSGLGRLAWEIYARGYTAQGSDFSLQMLLASDFILNGCSTGDSDGDDDAKTDRCKTFHICPWIAETKNVISFGQRIKSVVVPDVNPSDIQHPPYNDSTPPEFTMIAGEFLSLYSCFIPQSEVKHKSPDKDSSIRNSEMKKFHGIACSFFLDTAPSLPEYLITIYHMLVDEGILLHFGPLMYHWSGHGALLPRDIDPASEGVVNSNSRYQSRNAYLDPRYLSSIDFTWEEVRQMIIDTGFDIVEEEMNIPALYTAIPSNMMEVRYNCVFLVARKRKMSGTRSA